MKVVPYPLRVEVELAWMDIVVGLLPSIAMLLKMLISIGREI